MNECSFPPRAQSEFAEEMKPSGPVRCPVSGARSSVQSGPACAQVGQGGKSAPCNLHGAVLGLCACMLGCRVPAQQLRPRDSFQRCRLVIPFPQALGSPTVTADVL